MLEPDLCWCCAADYRGVRLTYKVLDLFSGIGGFSLGLERTGGFKTVAFCEIEPYPCKVLAKHWPDVPIYNDVRELTGDRLKADGLNPEIITAGFPCQDISVAGKGAGITGERSGLWSEIARLVGEIHPRYVILENVSALLNRGLEQVLRDLTEVGYDAEWHCIPASHIGAPHRRDRIWIVATLEHPANYGRNELRKNGGSLEKGAVSGRQGQPQAPNAGESINTKGAGTLPLNVAYPQDRMRSRDPGEMAAATAEFQGRPEQQRNHRRQRYP
jgi:DNA (cytosine-5)-methyltransferase 1